MENKLQYTLFLLGFFSGLIGTEAQCYGNTCANNPKPCCYVWPLSVMEKKMLSPFCHNGQVCYIWDDMAYSFTKCHGYCHASETHPAYSGRGVWTKCREHECSCCRPKVIEKMKVCVVCCSHPICRGRGPAYIIRPGQTPPPGGDPYPGRMPSKAEVERLAKQQHANKGGQSPLSPIIRGWPVDWTPWTPGPPTPPGPPGRPGRPWRTTTTTTTRSPPLHNVQGGHQCGCPGCCPPWATTVTFDVPRDCDCQTCV